MSEPYSGKYSASMPKIFWSKSQQIDASCDIGPKTENGLEKFEKEKEIPTENVILAALS